MYLKTVPLTNAIMMGAFVLLCNSITAQSVAINDNHSIPNASAILDINTYGGIKKGLLIPRLTTADITGIASPADGLMVYDTDLKQLKIYKTTTGWTRADFSLPYSGGATTVAGNEGVFEISYDGASSTTRKAAYFNGKSANGLFVNSDDKTALKATTTSGTGILVTATTGNALDAESVNNTAIYAYSANQFAIVAQAAGNHAVYGSTTSAGYAGVKGNNPGSGWGVIGIASTNGIGVEGSSGNVGIGVKGTAGNNGVGVYGSATGFSSYGIQAYSDKGTSLYTYSPSGTGIYAASDAGYAGIFSGRVIIEDYTSSTINPNLDVKETISNNYTRINLSNINSSKAWTIASITNGATEEMNFYLGSTVSGSGLNSMTIYGNGNVCARGVFFTCSDARLKKDFAPLNNSLNNLLQLTGYTYYWKDEHKDTRQQIGLLAQDVQKVLPLLVNTDTQGMLSVNYNGMVPVIINAMKELKAENEELKKNNIELEKRLGALEKRM